MQRIEIDEIVEHIKKHYAKYKNWLIEYSKNGENYTNKPWNDIFNRNIFGTRNKGPNFIPIYDGYGGKSNYFTRIKLSFLKWWLNNFNICPYCGKNSLIYFGDIDNIFDDNQEKRTFDLDHFLPKSSKNKVSEIYPHLAINLYNLIPACKACNFILNDANPLEGLDEYNKIFHPYFGWIYKYFKLSSYMPYSVKVILKDVESNINIETYIFSEIKVDNSKFDHKVTFVGNPNPEVDGRKQVYKTYHGKFFRLGEIYLNDQETFNIFDFIYDKYTKIKDEYQRFKKTSKSIEEFVDYFFKNYYPEKEQDILKYSNGKLKKDLIQYMEKILKNYYK